MGSHIKEIEMDHNATPGVHMVEVYEDVELPGNTVLVVPDLIGASLSEPHSSSILSHAPFVCLFVRSYVTPIYAEYDRYYASAMPYKFIFQYFIESGSGQKRIKWRPTHTGRSHEFSSSKIR